MKYYNEIRLNSEFSLAKKRITEALSEEGFGIITEINIKDTFKAKLDIDFRNYLILGACNPAYSHRALQAEDKVGTLLPCNVILQETENNIVEIAAVDPVESMQMINNPELIQLAGKIRDKLIKALDRLKDN